MILEGRRDNSAASQSATALPADGRIFPARWLLQGGGISTHFLFTSQSVPPSKIREEKRGIFGDGLLHLTPSVTETRVTLSVLSINVYCQSKTA